VKIPLLLLALAGLGACTSLTPVDDPVYLRLTDMEARLIRLERAMENEGLISLANEVSSMRTDVQAMRGEIEQLSFDAENQETRQRALYVDLDERLQALESSRSAGAGVPAGGFGGAGQFGAGAAVGGAVSGGVAQPQLTDQQAYDAAYQLIVQRQYPQAQAAFEAFLRNYPASALRDNAQYWLGEMHYVQTSYRTALAEFQRVISDYPQSDKLADALLKVGYCNYELGNYDAARQSLMQVVRMYPQTSAADLAQERLAQIAREVG
jgi:tol-pal system protein YbgF